LQTEASVLEEAVRLRPMPANGLQSAIVAITR